MYGASAPWAPAGAERFRLFEGNTAPAPAVAESGLSSLSTPSGTRQGRPLSTENPLLVFGALAALTFGLMAFSTSGSVRVGKTKLTAGVGVGNT